MHMTRTHSQAHNTSHSSYYRTEHDFKVANFSKLSHLHQNNLSIHTLGRSIGVLLSLLATFEHKLVVHLTQEDPLVFKSDPIFMLKGHL